MSLILEWIWNHMHSKIKAKVLSSPTLLWMSLLIHFGIKVNPCHKRDPKYIKQFVDGKCAEWDMKA